MHPPPLTTSRCHGRCEARQRRPCCKESTQHVADLTVTNYRLLRFDLELITDKAVCADLIRALCADGAVLLRLPAERLQCVQRCYEKVRGFFARPFAERTLHGAGPGHGQAHGYMEYLDDDDGSECFEAKVHHDQRFMWPERPKGFEAAVCATRDMLMHSAVTALGAIVSALQLDDVSPLLDLPDAKGHTPAIDLCTDSRPRTHDQHQSRRLVVHALSDSWSSPTVNSDRVAQCAPAVAVHARAFKRPALRQHAADDRTSGLLRGPGSLLAGQPRRERLIRSVLS